MAERRIELADVAVFVAELGVYASAIAWGVRRGDSLLGSVGWAVGAFAVFAVLWGQFAAPRAPHRLSRASLGTFELGWFFAGVILCVLAGHPYLAVALAALSMVALARLRVGRFESGRSDR